MSRLPLDWFETLQLDRDGDAALYQQLYNQLRDGILRGVLSSGLRLPGTRSLAKKLELARNTVLAAYEQLQAEGFLESQAGAGFWVAEGLDEQLQRLDVGESYVASAPVRLSRRGQQMLASQARYSTHLRLPLQPGEPDCDLFPLERWAMLASREIRSVRRGALSYGEPLGASRLREALSAYLGASRGVFAPADRILITSGAQQALDLCARLLLDEGDLALVEDPGYGGSRGAFITAGAKLQSLSFDDEGAVIPNGDHLAARVAYLKPSHQYPLGLTMSLQRRLAWLDFAVRQNCWLIEDDYDSEFRYDTKPLAAIQGLSNQSQHQVLYMGTFSKVLFPSLRLGYLVVPEALMDAFVKLRGFCDTQPATLSQLTLAAFIEQGHFASHIRRMRQIYADRRSLTLGFVTEHLSDDFSWRDVPAGMHLTLIARKPGWQDHRVAEQLRQQGVGARALSDYAVTSGLRGLVVGYAGHDETQLKTALQTLVRIVRAS